MNLKKRIGLKIAGYRKASNLKQEELAELVNISTKHQSRIENGVNFPSADLLESYAQVLKLDVANLLDIKNIDSPENIRRKLNDIIREADDNQLEILYKISRSIVE